MIIEYYTKSVYGNEMKYIKDKHISSMLFLLTGKKTITNSDMIALKGLGYELKEVLASSGLEQNN